MSIIHKSNKKFILLIANVLIVVLLVSLSIFSQYFSNSKTELPLELQNLNLYQQDFLFFGTQVNAQILASDSKEAAEAFESLTELYTQIHRDWHAWESGGLLMKINQAFKEGKSIEVPEAVADLIRQSQEISEQSEGYFNPAIGELIGLWGFLSEDWMNQKTIPNQREIQAQLSKNPKMSDIQISSSQNSNQKTLFSSNPNVRLDMGGIAKGYALDLALDLFASLNIPSALVNAGGDLKVLGMKFSEPWRVGIVNPFAEKPLGSVALGGHKDSILTECRKGCAVATSGIDQRYFIHNNEKYSHLIHPKTGYPANDIAQVSVVHPSATFADAAATALFVSGQENFQALAEKMGIRAFLIIQKDQKIVMSYHMNRIFTREQ